MSVVNPPVFAPNLTPEEVYNLINTLPISYWLFSQNTNYFARLFGVLTGERNQQDWTDFTINHCLRDAIWSTLNAVTQAAENSIGYNVSPRYHSRTMDWPQAESIRVWPGIESVDIVPEWSSIPGYDSVTISPFLDTIVSIVSLNPLIFGVSDTIVNNPLNIIFRRQSDYGTYSIDDTKRPVHDSGLWKITIDDDIVPYDGLGILVQDVRYTFVDVDTPACDGGIVYPVYPETNQIIPYAKQPEDIGGGQTRYWFYTYTLVNPAFYNNDTDLVAGDFYKLLDHIEFKCFKETPQKAVLTRTCRCQDCATCCSCSTKLYQVTTKIKDSERGVVEFCIDGELVFNDETEEYDLVNTSLCNFENTDCHNWSLTYHYKTNPDFLRDRYRNAVSDVMRAITFRTAAELPVIDCGCFLNQPDEKLGFIFRQQEPMGRVSVTQLTGTVTTQFGYGDLRGQQAYADILSKVPTFKFALL